MESWSGRGEHERPEGEPLSKLLPAWRRRTERYGLTAGNETGGPGLSRADIARLTGVTEEWYGSLEDGEAADCTEDFLDRLSTALGLSLTERGTLYERALGRPPSSAAIPQASAAVEMDDLFQCFIDNQSHPACVADAAWNVIGHNQPMRDWFPWTAHQGNMLRWALLSQDAREQLVNWREDWARSYVGQIRFARSRDRRNEALRRLQREVLANTPGAREMWHRKESRESGDGSLRRLRLPFHQGREVAVRIVALRPMRSDRLRVFVLMENCPKVIGS
ncbi:helix-turn-helix transcriptional regulator [Actinacidiphila paucisporea]|uniref:Helix-turn-helix domain-containing protein n=1 Tax=Actinacidiphila paucisporea TaxID=310782 RepID=A0A1M7IR47_9ACTN|nr:helix-turn-helix transcriptional regulator [Actinacidiphila paucisporea]SHM43078.1 Helix-turn-helix domain-containing protein [Actinacidiphila paucisporea]